MIQQLGLAARGLFFMGFLLLVNCGGSDKSDLTPGEVNISPLSLASLTLNNGRLSPDFDGSRLGLYTINVGADVSTIDFVATLSDAALADGASIRTFKRGAADEDETALIENISSGSTFSRTIAQGDNSFVVSVVRSDGKQIANYELLIHRVGLTAELSNVIGLNLSGADIGFSDEDVEFSSDVFEYEYTADYEGCRFGLAPFVAIEGSTVAVQTGALTDPFEGEPTDHLAYTSINLPLDEPGLIAFEVTSEQGDVKNIYTFTFIRNSTEEQRAADATLFDLSLSAGELDSSYSCLSLNYEARTNRNTPSTDLTLVPSVAGASMTITHVVTGDEVPHFDDETPITASVAFTLDLDVGDNVYAINVISSDTLETTTYRLVVERSETNWTYVDNIEDLQSALLSAVDYDEIILEEGEYLMTEYLSTSGSADAFLFSDVQAENKIVFRGDGANDVLSNGVSVVLDGGDLDANTMMKLGGKNWEIRNLALTNVRNGLVLDGANNNTIRSLFVNNIGERAIHLRNASSNNMLIDNVISDTGQSMREGFNESMGEAVVIGSDDADWASAPTAGEYDEADLNNTISGSTFGTGIPTEAIDIKEGTVGSVVQYNAFFSDGITDSAENNSVIAIKGNDVQLSYNRFIHTVSDDTEIDSVISVRDASESWHSIVWGNNTQIFDNVMALNEESIAAVSSQDGATALVDDNERTDMQEVLYSGEGVSSNFESPNYKIQSFLDEDKCLAPGTANFDNDYNVEDSSDVNTYAMLLLVDCNEAPEWVLSNAGAFEVNISDVDNAELVSANVSNYDSVLSFLNPNTVFTSSNPELYDWQIRKTADGIIFTNTLASSIYAITSSKDNGDLNAAFVDGDVAVYMAPLNGNDAQTFILLSQ